MKKDNNIKASVVSNLIWKFGERISAQLVTFIVSIVLARLLTPEDYGAISIVTIFITIANVFVVSGFGNSLIQKKDADNIDFSSVFYFNIVFSIILYAILFIIAPYIATMYNMDILCPVLRVLGLRLILAGVNSVQQAYVSRKMIFRKFFFSTLIGTILSSIVGIFMAYKGYGIWALVAQYLTNTTIDTIVLWITVKWRPEIVFSIERMKLMFNYGWKLLASSLIESTYNQLRALIIGSMYSSSDLAYYNRGQQYPNLVVENINSSINSVLFPAISKEQDDRERVKSITRKAIKISSYIMWPMMVGLAIIAKPLVLLMLTEKWLPCVPYLQIACFTYAFWPVHTANLQSIKALGKSDIYLKVEIIKKVLGVIILLISMKFGIMAIAMSSIIITAISCFINAYPNISLLKYTYIEQIKDMLPSMLLSIFMGIVIYPISSFVNNSLILIVVQILMGGVIYLVISALVHFEPYEYIYSLLKDKVLNRKLDKGRTLV